MTRKLPVNGLLAASLAFGVSACSTQEEMAAKPAPAPAARAEAKAPAKPKIIRARGNVGLLDEEKNYMILVTKEGKLITLDFDTKTKVTKITPGKAKIGDVGLGSSATVTYTNSKDKNVASAVEYRAKGGR